MGVPGWPELAAWTASMDRVRMVLMHNRSRRSCSAMGTPVPAAATTTGRSSLIIPASVPRNQKEHETDRPTRYLHERAAVPGKAVERMNELTRISISLENTLLEAFDRSIEAKG